MKTILTMSIWATALSSLVAQTFYTDTRDNKHIWGKFDLEALHEEPYLTWYRASLEDFIPDDDLFEDLGLLQDAEVDIYLGTWCGDSKAWVPKFVALWEELDLPMDRLNFIGLHNDDAFYKQSLNHEENRAHVHRVPTFVFRNGETEIGRIVERPITTLENDLAQIDRGVPAPPRYLAVNYLIDYFQQTSIDTSDVDQFVHAYRSIQRDVSGPGELNTYGYVLKAAGKKEEARFVFRLNAALFKYTPNCFDSLGELYLEDEDYERAMECYERVRALDPDDERALAMLTDIRSKMKRTN